MMCRFGSSNHIPSLLYFLMHFENLIQYSECISLVPRTYNPIKNGPWELVCDAEKGFITPVTITLPSGMTGVSCTPASPPFPYSCTFAAGYNGDMYESSNIVVINTTSLQDVNGTWSCGHNSETATYELNPIISIPELKFGISPEIFSENISRSTPSFGLSVTYGCINVPVTFEWSAVSVESNAEVNLQISSTISVNSSICSVPDVYGYTTAIDTSDIFNVASGLSGFYSLKVEVHYTSGITALNSKEYPFLFIFRPTSLTSTVFLTERIVTTMNYIIEYSSTTAPLTSNIFAQNSDISEIVTPSNFISEIITPYSVGKMSTSFFEAKISNSTYVSKNSDNSLKSINISEMIDISTSHITNMVFLSLDLHIETTLSFASSTTTFLMSNLFVSTFDSSTYLNPSSSQMGSFLSRTNSKTSFLETSDTSHSLVSTSIFASNPTTTESRIFMSGYLQSSFYPTEQVFLSKTTEYLVTSMQATNSFLLSSTEINLSTVNPNMRTTDIMISEFISSVYTVQTTDMLTIQNNSLIRTIVEKTDLRTTLVTSKSGFEHQMDSLMSHHSNSGTIAVNSLITAQSTFRNSFYSAPYSSDSSNVILSTSKQFLYDTSSSDFISTTIQSNRNNKAGISETTKNAMFITFVSVVVIIIISISSIMLLSRVLFERKRGNVSLSNESQSVRNVLPEFPYMKRSIYPRFSDSLSSYMTSPYERNWNEI